MEHLYATPEWAAAREAVLDRDGRRCTVARLLGGPCHPILDVHHVVPADECADPYDLDNLITVCHAHHPSLERLRRYLRMTPRRRRCPHNHRYDHARRECERRLNVAA